MRLTIHTAAMDRLLNAHDTKTFNYSWRFITNNFESLYSVADNVTEFKKAILQLALMGNLVPQDPSDQPASELLKEIEAEKKKLFKEGKIKKQEPLPPIKDNEIPYALPKGWEWIKLEEICTLITDGTHSTPHYIDEGIPFISVKDVSSGEISFQHTKFISCEEHKELTKRCKPEMNDILLTKIGTTGIAVTINTDKEFSIFVSVALLKFVNSKVYSLFLENLINSPLVRKYSKDGTEGVGNKNLVLRKIREFIIPLPPLNEQKRIVEKVNQLMVLCNTFEQQIKDSADKQSAIFNAVLAKLEVIK